MIGWHPNNLQWKVIWAVYVLTLVLSVDWTETRTRTRPLTFDERIALEAKESVAVANIRQRYGRDSEIRIALDPTVRDIRRQLRVGHSTVVTELSPSSRPSTLIVFLVIGGGLLVWGLQKPTA